MNDRDRDDIDYENLNDLPLASHIEWNHSAQQASAVFEHDRSDDDWLAA